MNERRKANNHRVGRCRGKIVLLRFAHFSQRPRFVILFCTLLLKNDNVNESELLIHNKQP